VNELRERSLRAEQEGEPLALLDDAADEIKRLRLTDEEREAMAVAMHRCDGPEFRTLRSLLDRLRP
jgi:hypothetical protein